MMKLKKNKPWLPNCKKKKNTIHYYSEMLRPFNTS